MKRPPLVLGTVPMACSRCGTTLHTLTMLRAGWADAPCRCEATCSECTLAEPISLHEAGAALVGVGR